MIHLYIAGGCLVVAIICWIGYMLIKHGRNIEKQKQTEWANRHLAEQQKQSKETGVRNAEIDSMSTNDLAKRSAKWVRD